MAKKKIYVSPSSQTDNKYAVGDTTEATQCRKIAKALVTALERCGFDGKTNTTGDMYARVRESNKWGANLHIAIHTNAHNKKVKGTRLFSYDLKGEGYKACKAVMATLAPITPGTSDNITAQPALHEVKQANAPTVYIEVAFHDNAEEARWIINHTEDIAEAICKGVCNHYGVKYVATAVNPAPAPEKEYIYRVQVGAYSKKSGAEKMLSDLRAAGFGGIIVKSEK